MHIYNEDQLGNENASLRIIGTGWFKFIKDNVWIEANVDKEFLASMPDDGSDCFTLSYGVLSDVTSAARYDDLCDFNIYIGNNHKGTTRLTSFRAIQAITYILLGGRLSTDLVRHIHTYV
jgi:hypothetical protein